MKKIKNISTKPPKNIFKSITHKKSEKLFKRLSFLQNMFYATGKHSLLIVLQGMDTSGKDGVIRHVFSNVNPQGCVVKSFKAPTEIEKLHDYLWRIYAHLPENGMIQIFNRSHYEDIIFPSVHQLINKAEIESRYKVMNDFEKHLQDCNTIIVKFYLHISKQVQNKRLNVRLTHPEKKWKYNRKDKKEAESWDKYMSVYQNIFDNCGKSLPWNIVPSDEKWYRNYFVAKTIVKTLESLNMEYPK